MPSSPPDLVEQGLNRLPQSIKYYKRNPGLPGQRKGNDRFSVKRIGVIAVQGSL